MVNTQLATFVANLEVVERWLEVGPSSGAPAVDFAAVVDLIDMCRDLTPDSWVTGLPDSASMPGFSADPSLVTDLLYRQCNLKYNVSAAADFWGYFPDYYDTSFGSGRVPIMGVVPNPIYDQTLLGAVKAWNPINTGSICKANVDDPIVAWGTDLNIGSTVMDTSTMATQAILSFTNVGVDEEYWVGAATASDLNTKFYDYNDADGIRNMDIVDSIAAKHPTRNYLRAYLAGEAYTGLPRTVEESPISSVIYMDAEDLGPNYAETWGKVLGIPYLK